MCGDLISNIVFVWHGPTYTICHIVVRGRHGPVNKQVGGSFTGSRCGSPSSWTMPHQRTPLTTNATQTQMYYKFKNWLNLILAQTNTLQIQTNIKTSYNNGYMHNNSAFKLKLIGHLKEEGGRKTYMPQITLNWTDVVSVCTARPSTCHSRGRRAREFRYGRRVEV